jgi:cell division septation protein DedD
MGDDFDLFPKRENLDPFSFGTSEKKARKEEAEDLFGEEGKHPPLPDLPLGDLVAGEKKPAQSPLSQKAAAPVPPQDGTVPPAPRTAFPEKEGPAREEKTFDEPVLTPDPQTQDEKGKKRKTPSTFVVVGGALIIILGILYGVLTFLDRDVPSSQPPASSAVSVAVEPQMPSPVPVPEPVKPSETAPPEPAVATVPAPATQEPPSTSPEPEPAAAAPAAKPVPAAPAPAAGPKTASAVLTPVPAPVDSGRFSVQVGALVLESSIRDLEKRLAALGYETFQGHGSTTAMMNMLTVGPFSSTDEAQKALSLIRQSGIDSNLVRRSDGEAVINAGSYLLDENANGIRKKIMAMGYPVELEKKEARLPLTFVRIGRFGEMDEATRIRDEIRGKGLEAIVVKLR